MATFSFRRISNVYVSASSVDMDRATYWMERLKMAGISVVSTWAKVIAEQGGDANPREASNDQRRQWSNVDLGEIRACDLLWFLVPDKDKPTRGAWLEVGFADAVDKVLVFSGDTKQSIFCSLGSEHESDIDAFATICRHAREGISR